MTNSQINDILTDKRRVDKENMDLAKKLNTDGNADGERRLREARAEEKRKQDLQHSIDKENDTTELLAKQLTEEEKKCKDMLDLKINAEQALDDLSIKHKEMKAKRAANKEDIIRQQLKLSQLKS